jgi:hypothetical protein
MTNHALLKVQRQVNRFIDSRKSFWTTNAEFVGSVRYLKIKDPLKKLEAKLKHLKRSHRFTPTQKQHVVRLTVAIASLSQLPTQSQARRVVA